MNKKISLLAVSLFFTSSLYSQNNPLNNGLVLNKDVKIPSVKPQIEENKDSVKKLEIYFDEKFNKYLEKIFGKEGEKLILERENLKSKSFSPDKLLYKMHLGDIKNKYLYSGAKFKISDDEYVYVSVTRASNCSDGKKDCELLDRIYMVVTENNKHHFIKINDIINVGIFKNGYRDLLINGVKYRFKLKASLSDTVKSRIQVENLHRNSKVLDFTLEKLSDGFSAAGVDLELNGKKLKILYGNKVLQDKNKAWFSDENAVFVMNFSFGDDFYINSVDKENELTTFKEAPGLGFMFVKDVLEVYSLN